MSPIGWDAEADRGGADEEEADDEIEVVRWTRWETAGDERTCPECGPLDGMAWPEEEGPQPPLHRHCRCERVFDHEEQARR